ncbi:MAG: DUF1926 domain-containing protein [Proteobacteria bacterium]|nr:DUF1926 domain-containing protein [Pseudomonadota bacterium]MBU1742970.1 DUF1926 domain-containing protein [Pseudomonadota bacterium]
MSAVSLVMALHLHQPVGNFDHVFRTAVETCYRPLIEHFDAQPGISFGLHLSGPLLDWLENGHPATLELIGRMIERGQVEIMSGGLYEPLLASIPPGDAQGQLEAMNRRLADLFGQRPRGFWLTERVWSPELPAVVAPAGLTYTFVDDTHFLYAGLSPAETNQYRITEKHGHRLALLPTSKHLRYLIPFRPVDEVIEHLLEMADLPGATAAFYGDDGEKFGLWPKTHDWVFRQKWLQKFLDALDEHRDRIVTMTPGEYLEAEAPAGRVYVPSASYAEMAEWALPVAAARHFEDVRTILEQEDRLDDWRPFIRGGVWDNFLVKYPEANLMHKKMLRLSRLVRQTGVDPMDLYQAQCNCAYWHGLFGGLYLPHLRHAVHAHLISGHKKAQAAQHGTKPWRAVAQEDLTADGHREVIAENPHLGLVFSPRQGGSLIQWDARDENFCLTNTLGRRPEAYHRHLKEPAGAPPEDQAEGVASAHDLLAVKEERLADQLVYDRYPRHSFMDHFLAPDLTPEAFVAGAFRQRGDFVGRAYETQVEEQEEVTAIRLSRRGLVVCGEAGADTELTKTFWLGHGPTLKVDYLVQGPTGVNLGVEFNLTLLSDQGPDRFLQTGGTGGTRLALDRPGTARRVRAFSLVSRGDGFKVMFDLQPAVDLWLFPIETVSMSESGLERIHQGLALVLIKDVPPKGTLRLSMNLEVVRITP